MAKNQYKKEPLKNNVEEMFIGPFGSSLKNECFVDEEDAYCMVYEQKHAIQKTLDGKNRFVDKNKYYELKRFTIKPGDIIVSCRGTIGETFIVPENAPLGIMHPSIMKIRLKPNVYNIEYFNLLLKNRLKDYNKSANGSGIKMAISATELGKELFPIPPMDEQQKTSKIFLIVNHLILLRQQQLAKLDELVKARFVEMFGDVFLNPMEWPEKTLESIADIVSGITKGRKTTETDLQEVPYMAVSNVKDGYIDWTAVKTILATRQEIEQYRLMPDDILMTEGGDPDKVGRGAIIKVPLKNSIHQNHIFRVRLDEQEILPSFFAEYLRHQKAKRYFLGCAKQTTGIASINMRQLRALPTLVPPLSLQKQFAAFVERVDQQKQTVQQSLEKLELMKKALMQEYFG